jgi:hypothetical protein
MVSADGMLAGWMVLNDLLGDLKSRGVFIPDLTYADLRNSKMVIEYLRAFEREIATVDQQDVELRSEMETRMLRLKETLMIWAEQNGGAGVRRIWERRFDDAVQGKGGRSPPEPKIPISDLPREKDVAFFRIRLPDEIPVEIVSELAEDCRVHISLDGDRHLQVSGRKECVRDAMKRLGEIFYGQDRTASE